MLKMYKLQHIEILLLAVFLHASSVHSFWRTSRHEGWPFRYYDDRPYSRGSQWASDEWKSILPDLTKLHTFGTAGTPLVRPDGDALSRSNDDIGWTTSDGYDLYREETNDNSRFGERSMLSNPYVMLPAYLSDYASASSPSRSWPSRSPYYRRMSVS